MPQIGLFERSHADLAASLRSLGTENTVPPLLLCREYGNTVFDAKLAAAMLEAPAAFIAHHQAAARTGEGEGAGVEATVTQAATPAVHGLQQDDAAAYQRGQKSSQPNECGKRVFKKSYADSKQRAAAQQQRKKPNRPLEQRKKASRKCAEQTDQDRADTRHDGANDRSEKLCRDPEKSKSKQQAGLMKTRTHSQTA